MNLFYGWRMTAASCGIQFLLAALVLQSFGLYIATLSDEMGWSKTSLSAAAALQSVEAAIIGPVLGWVVDRFGSPIMIRFGVVIMGIGLASMSQIDTLGGFYVCAIIMAVGTSFCGYFPLSVALVQWFERHRARALSIMSSGLALGGLAVPLVAWVMQTWGWRTAALASGLTAILLGLPLALIMVRRPQDLGLQMDGDSEPAVASPPGTVQPIKTPSAPEFTAAQALRTKAFWYLAAGHGLALVVVTAVNVHAITHMKEGLGYSVAQASFVITLMTIGQAGGVALGYAIGYFVFDQLMRTGVAHALFGARPASPTGFEQKPGARHGVDDIGPCLRDRGGDLGAVVERGEREGRIAGRHPRRFVQRRRIPGEERARQAVERNPRRFQRPDLDR